MRMAYLEGECHDSFSPRGAESIGELGACVVNQDVWKCRWMNTLEVFLTLDLSHILPLVSISNLAVPACYFSFCKLII